MKKIIILLFLLILIAAGIGVYGCYTKGLYFFDESVSTDVLFNQYLSDSYSKIQSITNFDLKEENLTTLDISSETYNVNGQINLYENSEDNTSIIATDLKDENGKEFLSGNVMLSGDDAYIKVNDLSDSVYKVKKTEAIKLVSSLTDENYKDVYQASYAGKNFVNNVVSKDNPIVDYYLNAFKYVIENATTQTYAVNADQTIEINGETSTGTTYVLTVTGDEAVTLLGTYSSDKKDTGYTLESGSADSTFNVTIFVVDNEVKMISVSKDDVLTVEFDFVSDNEYNINFVSNNGTDFINLFGSYIEVSDKKISKGFDMSISVRDTDTDIKTEEKDTEDVDVEETEDIEENEEENIVEDEETSEEVVPNVTIDINLSNYKLGKTTIELVENDEDGYDVNLKSTMPGLEDIVEYVNVKVSQTTEDLDNYDSEKYTADAIDATEYTYEEIISKFGTDWKAKTEGILQENPKSIIALKLSTMEITPLVEEDDVNVPTSEETNNESTEETNTKTNGLTVSKEDALPSYIGIDIKNSLTKCLSKYQAAVEAAKKTKEEVSLGDYLNIDTIIENCATYKNLEFVNGTTIKVTYEDKVYIAKVNISADYVVNSVNVVTEEEYNNSNQ